MIIGEIRMIFIKKSEKYNPIVKRREVEFKIDHTNEGTPSRSDVISYLASEYKVKTDLIALKKIVAKSGTNTTVGYAEIYNDANRLKQFIPQYIKNRTAPSS